MLHYIILFGTFASIQASMYINDIPPEQFLTDLRVLRNFLINNDIQESDDSYLENRQLDSQIPLNEYSPEIPLDFDGIDDFEPKTNIRDQEYLKHSSLWSRQDLGSYISFDQNRLKPIKDEKQENQLPAYCTPPNPCPVGYTKENNCLDEFENTAEFSRDFQSSQDCMCDHEHMADCSKPDDAKNNIPDLQFSTDDFEKIVQRFEEDNPYFKGEKLPIAAKKGFHIGF